MAIKTRNWTAVSSWFRNSAGPITDEKKEANKNACRDFEHDEDEYIPFGVGVGDPDKKLVGLEYHLTGFESSYNEFLVEQIKLEPTKEQVEQVVGECNTYNVYPLTSQEIKEIFNLDVNTELAWFFETTGIYK